MFAQPVVIQDKILREERADASVIGVCVADGVYPVKEIARECISLEKGIIMTRAVATLPVTSEAKPRKYALIRGNRKLSVEQRDESDIATRPASREASSGFARRGFITIKGR